MKKPASGWPLLVLVLLCLACRKDRPEVEEEPPAHIGGSGGAYIVNEGNFQWGNAKVGHYDLATGTAVEDLYAPANGEALGDVCQSMRLFNGKAYVVVNNSGKVVVVDPATFVATAVISGLSSPRYFLPVSNGKAYITDLHAGALAIVDLASNTVTGHIPCPGATEELVLALGKAFVTSPSRDKVYVIDTATDLLQDSIAVGPGGNSIVEDATGDLWVACSGSAPALHRIDPQAMAVEASFPFPLPSDSPWRLDINGGNDTLYYLNGGVYRMPITATALPTAPFVAADGRNFYGIGIEPSSGVLHVADASDYVQRGTVYRYRPDGTLAGTYLAGIIPSDFVFH